jgi:serine/tyrosine/threonine adenylyltransferase
MNQHTKREGPKKDKRECSMGSQQIGLEFPPMQLPNLPALGALPLQALHPDFFAPVQAQALPDPHWVAWSAPCAALLNLPATPFDAALPVLSGNSAPTQALASVYSGHQFGQWAGQLGDGRALLLGQWPSQRGMQEIQLKGAGPTPYSRRGDGRAVLRSSIREFLCSEAFAALGLPTTRALCVVGSPLPVQRETWETAAVVTRVAPSFMRFGHFEHFAHTQPDTTALKHLADEAIRIGYPQCAGAAHPYLSLLTEVARSTAELVAAWQSLGFCHGVLNTDNMSILGLTLDYGPFGFLDAYAPGHVCNHSDTQGRYAFHRQPQIAFWNLHALAQSMLALLPKQDAQDKARQAVQTYADVFPLAYQRRFRNKLGLQQVHAGDPALLDGLLALMAADAMDFTQTFRALAHFKSVGGNAHIAALFPDRTGFGAWASAYCARLQTEHSHDGERTQRMNQVNPKYILRNHLAQAAINQAQQGDFSKVQQLLQTLQHPFDEQPDRHSDSTPPPPGAQQLEISCSS